MTASTGARKRMRRRQELFSAELKLRRVMLHMLSSIAWAVQLRADAELHAQRAAFDSVYACYKRVMKEQEELAQCR
jgi:hypothetical protein